MTDEKDFIHGILSQVPSKVHLQDHMTLARCTAALSHKKQWMTPKDKEEGLSRYRSTLTQLALAAKPYNESAFGLLATIIDRSTAEEISPAYLESFKPILTELTALKVHDRWQPYEAYGALDAILKKSTEPPDETIKKFRTLLPRKQGTYNGHSVGFETEFYADEKHYLPACRDGATTADIEVRSGPFMDDALGEAEKMLRTAHAFTCLGKEEHLSTLHMNFGLTAQQLENVKQYEVLYASILNKVSYLANSAERNKRIVFDQDSPSYIHDENNTVSEHLYEDCSGKGEQVARLECRHFCLAKDASLDLVMAFIPAFWKALDDPKRALALYNNLGAIFAAADIWQSSIPFFNDLMIEHEIARNEIPAKKWPPEWHSAITRINEWEQDFGMIDKDDNVTGRQVFYRPLVTQFLKFFAYGREDEVLPEILKVCRSSAATYRRELKAGNPKAGRPYREQVKRQNKAPASGIEGR